MIIHHMSLNSPWFELVKSGVKIYEGRRITPKVNRIKKGDIIEFKHHIDSSIPIFNVIVEDILSFPTFRHALEILPIQYILPIPNITVDEGVNIYYKYVSQTTQEKDGVIMLKVSVIEDVK